MKGHIRQKGDDRWEVIVDIGPDPVTGRRRQRSRTVRGTRADAERLRIKLVGEVDDGRFVDDGTLRVADLAQMWIDARRTQVRPNTLEGYQHKLKHLVDAMGDLQARRVSGASLSALYGRLIAGGLSPRSVLHVHRVASRMFADAVRWGLLRENPANRADPPSIQEPELKVWTGTEIATFLAAASTDRWAPGWWLAATTGMRRSEVLGLRWSDVDLNAGHLEVRQTLVLVDGRRTFGKPKTKRSRRVIPIGADLVEVLRAGSRRQAEMRLALGSGWENHDLVVTLNNGRPVHPREFYRRFIEISEDVGLPRIRLHDLRHSFGTLAMESKVQPRVISDILGHATTAITQDIYGHPSYESHREAVADVLRELGLG